VLQYLKLLGIVMISEVIMGTEVSVFNSAVESQQSRWPGETDVAPVTGILAPPNDHLSVRRANFLTRQTADSNGM
jgi:hypothetical protein